ncbi:MAG: cysteine desulfurase NifS [Candidatus Margulisbacteria bacterium]|nr:cysteine desulfurase NifS [Candidatus Margulisiibacteriota bacterium]
MNSEIYLDHNATTYVEPKVVEAMIPYFTEKFANPSGIYSLSQNVSNDIQAAREKIQELLHAKKGKLIFTGGGSESDNLAIKGYAYANQNKGKHIITSQIEHHAVLHTCEQLEKEGFTVTYLPVDTTGIVKLEELKKAIQADTLLISIMYANNETGVIQPIKEIINIAHQNKVAVHTDAVQIVGKQEINIDDLGVDLLSFSAHKFYGPKGIGGLFVKKGIKIHNIIQGGGQEFKLRAGTENTAGIIGTTKALEIAMQNWEEDWNKEKALRDELEQHLLALIPESQLNGHVENRLANTLNIIIKYIEGEGMLLLLNNNNIYASSGSACTSGSLDPSHVLLAMGIPHEHAHGSLRFSLGRKTTQDDIKQVIEVLPKIVEKLRAMSPLYNSKNHPSGFNNESTFPY